MYLSNYHLNFINIVFTSHNISELFNINFTHNITCYSKSVHDRSKSHQVESRWIYIDIELK